MAETATVAFETTDLIARLLCEVEEIVALISRPVEDLPPAPPPLLAPAPVPS